jgi:hypothetical protein
MDMTEDILKQTIHDNFETWRIDKERGIERDFANRSFVQAWANIAYLAEYQRNTMGHEKNKLQQRIGRQRKANNKLVWRVKELELEVKKQKERIRELGG